MSRTIATLPAGSRITDYVSLGVVAKTFPLERIHAALALYMHSSYREVLRCLLEGIQRLLDPSARI